LHVRTTQQDTVGYRIPGTDLVYNSDTGTSCWRNCKRCFLHIGTRRIAVRRDGTHRNGGPRLLFIGKYSGSTESVTGIPFSGTSGRILEYIFSQVDSPFHYCLTNLLGCQTFDVRRVKQETDIDEEGSVDENVTYEYLNYGRDPSNAEINACSGHITELISSYKPRAIVYLGPTSQNFHTNLPTCSLIDIDKISSKEYKVLTCKKEARKLTLFLDGLNT